MNTEGETVLDDIQIILGDLPVPDADFVAFLREKGREYTPATLPEGIERGPPKNCFANAFWLSFNDKTLTYVEGVGEIPSLRGTGFLHAWCVDPDGNVVDPTWAEPEKCRYHGVEFDRTKLNRHIVREEVYGVFGGANKSARKILAKGGL